ncbi:MAG: hypothetical protein COB67_11940 [SAR324 cluster bacterium]|uniref:NADH-quinone oxidoreductase subunit J n=1 Tax=SAR324 cluster bacterium TaxID=2024889 RepID=A0A2A4SS82_9DELT|nr:MAG: hypothetical protein COB67_11940 [SAR324 cluster bacterium]
MDFIYVVFGFWMVFFSFAVITLVNPVHSAICLVCSFLNAALILFCLGADFLGFVFILVYVGAIAIFFLLVIMLLNVKHNPIKLNFIKYGPVAAFICFAFVFESLLPFINVVPTAEIFSFSDDINFGPLSVCDSSLHLSNIDLFGQLLYTKFFIFFLIVGLILLIALLGAVLLTYSPGSNKVHTITKS